MTTDFLDDERASDRIRLQASKGLGSRHLQETCLTQSLQDWLREAPLLLCFVRVLPDERADFSRCGQQRFIYFERHFRSPL